MLSSKKTKKNAHSSHFNYSFVFASNDRRDHTNRFLTISMKYFSWMSLLAYLHLTIYRCMVGVYWMHMRCIYHSQEMRLLTNFCTVDIKVSVFYLIH